MVVRPLGYPVRGCGLPRQPGGTAAVDRTAVIPYIARPGGVPMGLVKRLAGAGLGRPGHVPRSQGVVATPLVVEVLGRVAVAGGQHGSDHDVDGVPIRETSVQA